MPPSADPPEPGLTEPADLLGEGLDALGLVPGEAATDRLLAYLHLLQRWNRPYNLTAVRAPSRMVTLHLLDSLSVLPYLRGTRILDVGTGAGLPGLILAIVRPDLDCLLLDGNGKKTRFCLQAVAELGLSNVQVVHARVEAFSPMHGFDTVIARAFSRLVRLVDLTARLATGNGLLLVMKGVYPGAELAEVAHAGECVKVEPLRVPGLQAQRHLVIADPACLANAGLGASAGERGE